MTAQMIFQKFQTLFPDFAEKVRSYKRVDTNQISMILKTGGICTFSYSKSGRHTEFHLNGKVLDEK